MKLLIAEIYLALWNLKIAWFDFNFFGKIEQKCLPIAPAMI